MEQTEGVNSLMNGGKIWNLRTYLRFKIILHMNVVYNSLPSPKMLKYTVTAPRVCYKYTLIRVYLYNSHVIYIKT